METADAIGRRIEVPDLSVEGTIPDAGTIGCSDEEVPMASGLGARRLVVDANVGLPRDGIPRLTAPNAATLPAVEFSLFCTVLLATEPFDTAVLTAVAAVLVDAAERADALVAANDADDDRTEAEMSGLMALDAGLMAVLPVEAEFSSDPVGLGTVPVVVLTMGATRKAPAPKLKPAGLCNRDDALEEVLVSAVCAELGTLVLADASASAADISRIRGPDSAPADGSRLRTVAAGLDKMCALSANEPVTLMGGRARPALPSVDKPLGTGCTMVRVAAPRARGACAGKIAPVIAVPLVAAAGAPVPAAVLLSVLADGTDVELVAVIGLGRTIA